MTDHAETDAPVPASRRAAYHYDLALKATRQLEDEYIAAILALGILAEALAANPVARPGLAEHARTWGGKLTDEHSMLQAIQSRFP